jgi:hypothetical protein
MKFVGNFLDGMLEMGLPIAADPNDGTCVGAMINPSSMNAQNQSRCDSRTAYLDPVIDRPNLHVATEQMVSQVLLEELGNPDSSQQRLQKAIGVEVCHLQVLYFCYQCPSSAPPPPPRGLSLLIIGTEIVPPAVLALKIEPQEKRDLLDGGNPGSWGHLFPRNSAIIRHRP